MAIENLSYDNGSVRFRVVNAGEMDVSDVGVAVVINDRYSTRRYIRIPWLRQVMMRNSPCHCPSQQENR